MENLKDVKDKYKKDLKYVLKVNKITHKEIAESINLTSQEFYNMLVGFQKSVPAKKIYSYEHFITIVTDYLRELGNVEDIHVVL
jgi:hypothetical protein